MNAVEAVETRHPGVVPLLYDPHGAPDPVLKNGQLQVIRRVVVGDLDQILNGAAKAPAGNLNPQGCQPAVLIVKPGQGPFELHVLGRIHATSVRLACDRNSCRITNGGPAHEGHPSATT